MSTKIMEGIMYRLLLVVDPGSKEAEAYSSVFSADTGFAPLCFAADAEEAGRLIQSEKFDAVGVKPGTEEEERISALLAEISSPLPMFILQEDHVGMMRDLKHLLNRLNADYSDVAIPLREMVGIVTTELVHNLLDGSLKNPQTVPRWFRMLRKERYLSYPCRVWRLSIPQGEGYLAGRWHYGTQRLESALCHNFFDRADPEADYFLAFLDSCSARMIAIPRDEGADFDRMDKAVRSTVEDIKDYLDLDILIAGAETVPDLTAAALPAAL